MPSARASRDMVACQKRAAARAGMLDSLGILLCLFMAFLITEPKLAQAQEQIYPQRSVNVGFGAGSSFYGFGNGAPCRGWRGVGSGNHEENRGQNDCSRNNRPQRNGFAYKQPA